VESPSANVQKSGIVIRRDVHRRVDPNTDERGRTHANEYKNETTTGVYGLTVLQVGEKTAAEASDR
jgi:hypothetical protein